jgi:MinD-like ATPase involved in chromosome partitioning or flagellar assembly
MSKIISINSFRRGVGCSSILVNLAVLLAASGQRAGAVDTNIQSPTLHTLFGLDEDEITATLYDYLWSKCDIEQVAHKVSLPSEAGHMKPVFLIPASTKTKELARVLRQGYDVQLLNAGLQQLVEMLNLDVLLIDTQPGLNEETLLSFALSDVLVILLRTDQQDYQGTGTTVQVARQLNVPRLMLIVNEAPPVFDLASVKSEVARTYDCEVAAVLPHSNKLMALAGTGLFALHYPDHPVAAQLKQVAASLMA